MKQIPKIENSYFRRTNQWWNWVKYKSTNLLQISIVFLWIVTILLCNGVHQIQNMDVTTIINWQPTIGNKIMTYRMCKAVIKCWVWCTRYVFHVSKHIFNFRKLHTCWFNSQRSVFSIHTFQFAIVHTTHVSIDSMCFSHIVETIWGAKTEPTSMNQYVFEWMRTICSFFYLTLFSFNSHSIRSITISQSENWK